MEVLEPCLRREVPQQERWNAESVFATPDDWESAFEAVERELATAERFCGRLAEGPELLADWLAYTEDLGRRFSALAVYANMAFHTDATDHVASDRYDRTNGLAAALAEALSFERPELLAIGAATLREWTEREPRLAHLGHFVDRLEAAAGHTRSAEIESLLGSLASPFTSATAVHGILANAELDFGSATDSTGREHVITQSTNQKLLSSPDRVLRRSAYTLYADAHLALQNSMAALLKTGVRQNIFMARARRYASPLHAALEPENLPPEVFHNLIATFRANLPIWHRYWRAKRRALDLESFTPYDIPAPLSEEPPIIPYQKAVRWLAEAMSPLGREYISVMQRGALADRWVDRNPNRGKWMGAFSCGAQGTHPFIMMSWTNDVSGMSTLAHELGHSMHSYLAWSHQPWVYSSYSLFVAEVASNFNQAMLRNYLFRIFRGNRTMELALIEEAMSNFYRYFFVMPTLARFELEIHMRVQRGATLGAKEAIDLMAELFAEGYGDEVEFEVERVGITWAQFHTHLYSHFYVYQYATGISGAHTLAHRVLDGNDGAAERYLDLLKAGGSRYPLDALHTAGVDLLSPAPVEETFGVLSELVERLETLGG